MVGASASVIGAGDHIIGKTDPTTLQGGAVTEAASVRFRDTRSKMFEPTGVCTNLMFRAGRRFQRYAPPAPALVGIRPSAPARPVGRRASRRASVSPGR